MSSVKDIGAYIKGVTVLTNTTATTAATEVTGPAIDRRSYGHAQSAKLIVPISYIKATGPTITVTPALQHSSASTTGFADLSTGAAVTVAAGTSSTAATLTIAELDADLTTAKRYLRISTVNQITTVSTVNAMTIMGVLVLGGQDVLPAA